MKSLFNPLVRISLLLGLCCVFLPVSTFSKDKETPTAEKKEEKKIVGSIRPSGNPLAADLPSLAKITFQQALDKALAAVPGSVLKAELEVEEGNLMYSFEILNAKKKVLEVEIDAGDGKVLDIDAD